LNPRRTIRAAALLLAVGVPGAPGAAEAPPPAAPAPTTVPAQPGSAAPQATSPASPTPAAPIAEPPGSGPVVTLTLEEAIRTALVNNPSLHVSEGLQRQASARIGEAGAAAGPAITASGSYTESGPIPQFTFSSGPGRPPMRVSLGSSRTRLAAITGTYIPDIFGRIRSSVRVARFEARAANEATAATINSLTYQVQRDYQTVLRNQSLVEVNRQAVADSLEQLRIADAQYRAGTVPHFDVLRASVQVENNRQAQTVAESNVATALADLVNVLGIDPNTRLQVTPLPITPLPPPLPAGTVPGTAPAVPGTPPAIPVPAPGPAPAHTVPGGAAPGTV
jgi:outer membrane protein TolC